jgi:apolipoprotein D and lipocalin family protein
MTTTTSPLPANLQHADATEGDIDVRIRNAELRLITREENLHRRVAALGERVQEATRPRRLLAPLAGAVVAVGALWWLWRRRGVARPIAAPAAEASFSPLGGGPWMGLLGLVVPLLPDRWRSRLSPATVSTVMAVAGTLLAKLRERRENPPLITAGPITPGLLDGAWHELAHLRSHPQRDTAAATAATLSFTARADGRMDLLIDGAPPAVAEALPGSGGAKLRVSHWPAALLWLPLAWHELWVLHVDEERGELLLGSPSRDTLQLLAREPQLTADRSAYLLGLARDRGFAVERLHHAGLA